MKNSPLRGVFLVCFSPLDKKQHQKGNGNNTDDPRPGKGIVAGIQCDINGRRQCLRNTGDVPCKHQCCAKFSERPREAEDASGQQ